MPMHNIITEKTNYHFVCVNNITHVINFRIISLNGKSLINNTIVRIYSMGEYYTSLI